MKTLSKVLCLLMVAAMCMSFFGASASALSFSVGGTGSSSTGGIRIPVGGSGTDETDDDDDISAPATTPAIDEGFGAGEPDETEGYSPEIDKEEDEDFSNAIDKMAEALKNGQRTLKFNGYFCFDKELVIDAGMDVAIVLANGAEVEDTDNIIVNGTVRISGSGCMGALPTVNDGGKLIISGGSFTEDPSKYLADGYKVDTTSGYFDVVKDNETKEEPEVDEKPKDEDTSTYIDIDEEGLKTIVLTPNEFNKGTDEQITANYNSNDVNFQFFFLVSTTSEEVTGEDFLTPEVDFTVDHTGKGNSIVYLKNSFLNGKDEGYYWFGGGRYSGSSVDLTNESFHNNRVE